MVTQKLIFYLSKIAFSINFEFSFLNGRSPLNFYRLPQFTFVIKMEKLLLEYDSTTTTKNEVFQRTDIPSVITYFGFYLLCD